MAIWINDLREHPPNSELVWVKTLSGIVATGYWNGYTWAVNGYRITDPYDSVVQWNFIEYPE